MSESTLCRGRTFTLAISGVALLALGPAAAPAVAVDYLRDIRPLLAERCYACHGALEQESSLRLDTGTLIRQGGDSGTAIVPGDPEESLLVERITAEDDSERMPPEGEPLTAEQIAAIRAWIAEGAETPENEQPEPDPTRHWAFQAPVRPPVPRIDREGVAESGEGAFNPIDAFITAKLAAEGLSPAPPATKSIWLRRVYLDLVGLPPTRDELQAFLSDDSPAAYSRVVDRLLESPLYGERWGRHWMDVWRYSDWYGRRSVPDVWNSAPQIWRWRDWIVRSLNADKGYDRMVAEMLAADEIAPEDPQAAVATGFLIRNWYALNPNDWMRSNVEHTGKAFLGLTFNCAHCHDHKYDPITHEDYFRFRAFFEPIGIRQDRVAGEADPGPFQEYEYSVLRKIQPLGAVRIYDRNPDAPTWFYNGGDERNRAEERGSIAPGVPEIFADLPLNVEAVPLPPAAWYPGLRQEIQETVLAECRAACEAAAGRLAAARQAAEVALPPLRAEVERLESAFSAARLEAERSGQLPAPLRGQQSLWIDATEGRRVLQHGLTGLRSLEAGSTLRFQLEIVKDAHFNFQLAKDAFQGLTAGLVAFDQGRLISYRPGSFDEFEVGRYDFSSGQRRFEVELVLQPEADVCHLTVRTVADDQAAGGEDPGSKKTPGEVLAQSVPVALNGWNPVGDARKGISFDARTGSVVGIDDVEFITPPSEDASAAVGPSIWPLDIDFEPPRYPAGQDVMGFDGWFGSASNRSPARSGLSLPVGNESLLGMWRSLAAARRGVDAEELKVRAAEAQQIADAAQLASAEARIAADLARYSPSAEAELSASEVAVVVDLAVRREREAAWRVAQAQGAVHEQALAAAEARPLEDAERLAAIEAAEKQLATSLAAIENAAQAIHSEPSSQAKYAPLTPVYPQTSTGRRRALAAWITHRDNPLTARVAVNHIWMRHFHSPLVDSVFDFGRSGASPTHPELLDWLAVELMESGWEMKRLHRLITLSNAYRRSSSHPHAGLAMELDPENELLWRMNVGRMEAEVTRDSLLYSADRLDFRMGGRELENELALTTHRRTLYYSCHPEADGKSTFGALFDAPEPAECYRRTESILPQQALALTNSELIHQLSGEIAERIWQSLPPQSQAQPEGQASPEGQAPPEPQAQSETFVRVAFERILSRSPRDSELAVCEDYLAESDGSAAAAETEAAEATSPEEAVARRESLIRALLNHNDFIAIR